MVPARFAVATHILLLLAGASPTAAPVGRPVTSAWLAAQVRTNPVVVRRIGGQLARAGLVRVRRGTGGAELARPAASITLEDIWQAVNGAGGQPLLALHAAAKAPTPAGGVSTVLAAAFVEVEAAFRAGLRGITLHGLVERIAAEAGPPRSA